MRRGSPSIVSLLLSDSQLTRLAAKGDDQAIDAIFRRHQPDLYRFCLAMTGDPQQAQEATQNTLARVRRALPEKGRRTKLKPWLYRIARDEVSAVRAETAHAPQAETEESRAQMRHLFVDLERLSPNQRAVLVMRELSGLDFAQIGSAFETNPSTARETLYEARLRLQQVERNREASCADTMRRLSDGDGRLPWRLGVQLHLRGCPDCRAFREEIANRRGGLAVLAPLPLAVGGSALIKVTATAAAVVAVASLPPVDRDGPPERNRDGGRAASLRGAPLAATAAPDWPSPGRRLGAATRATPGPSVSEAPDARIDGQPARRSFSAVAPGEPSPPAAPHSPAVAPTPLEETERPGIAAHVPSSPDPTPEVGASGPSTADEETSPTAPLADFEPDAEAADVADAALEPPTGSPVDDPSGDSAAPLPSPPAPEAEPPSGRPDRPRHRGRPWRKRR